MEKHPDFFSSLNAILTRLSPISETDWKLFSKYFKLRKVPARTLLIRDGEVSDELFFVSSGLLRLYYQTIDNESITAFLFSENMFAGSLESFLLEIPSNQSLETLEPSVLLVVHKSGLDQLYKQVPVSHIIMRKVMEQRFIASQRLLASYILLSPQKRYEQFCSDFPHLHQRVPQNIIASFLGITPVSLSRIRKRMAMP